MANGNTNFGNDQGTGTVGADGFLGPLTGAVTSDAVTVTPTIVAAGGSNSQSGATAITKALTIITTVSATTRAVRLPTPATGKFCWVGNSTTTAAKIYPSTGAKIGAASTNALGSNRITANRANLYIGVSATKWILQATG